MAPNTELSTRALIVTLKSPFGGKSTTQISAITEISPRTIDAIYGRACQRGFEPNAPMIKLLSEHLEDAPRAGRPRKQEAVHKAAIEKVLASVGFAYRRDSLHTLASDLNSIPVAGVIIVFHVGYRLPKLKRVSGFLFRSTDIKQQPLESTYVVQTRIVNGDHDHHPS
ncbi:hypothetical protein A1F94_001836 [Pyrenophora tritici-repentis]|nr:hypothetical protein A1F94_001836 [Pyrenophora tritici-repentis]